MSRVSYIRSSIWKCVALIGLVTIVCSGLVVPATPAHAAQTVECNDGSSGGIIRYTSNSECARFMAQYDCTHSDIPSGPQDTLTCSNAPGCNSLTYATPTVSGSIDNTGLIIYRSYNDIHSALGQAGIDTPMRYGSASSEYGYNHIMARVRERPDTHVGEPFLSLITQFVLTNSAAAVVDTPTGYNVTSPYIDGNIWTVVVSEQPIADPGKILGIITVFKVAACPPR